MKSFATLLVLACAASAASIQNNVFRRSADAVCNAKKGESCPGSDTYACENNGGHSMFCVAVSPGKYQWIYGDNCPKSNQHCDCATGRCAPNGK